MRKPAAIAVLFFLSLFTMAWMYCLTPLQITLTEQGLVKRSHIQCEEMLKDNLNRTMQEYIHVVARNEGPSRGTDSPDYYIIKRDFLDAAKAEHNSHIICYGGGA